jgi:hypothetical protein
MKHELNQTQRVLLGAISFCVGVLLARAVGL